MGDRGNGGAGRARVLARARHRPAGGRARGVRHCACAYSGHRRGSRGVTPFKGLASFTDSELDASLFFGRDRDIQTIAANLIASRFTVLFGVSGVGKSSVLSAGVLRRIRELAPEALVVAYRDWTGVDQRHSLAASIPGLEPGSGRSLADALAGLTESRGSEVYLVLDQFE